MTGIWQIVKQKTVGAEMKGEFRPFVISETLVLKRRRPVCVVQKVVQTEEARRFQVQDQIMG